jgi:DNA-binding MarR family transcriptional regulator/ribosomal protein S18 acetylase RimI-like enzyme
MPVNTKVADAQIGALRHFNRFYTRQLGLLDRALQASPFSLTEVRVLYAIASVEAPTAAVITRQLGLDAGYTSRLLSRFREGGLLVRSPSECDGRSQQLQLTRKGRAALQALDKSAGREAGKLLGELAEAERERLVKAMAVIETVLGDEDKERTGFILRGPEAGDMGWVVQRHGAIYAAEYGWNREFELVVAEIAEKFFRHHDPERERCWIAEWRAMPVGSIFVVRRSATVAQMRLLIVDPAARGLGIGRRLVQEAIRFSRHAGYRKLTLWTDSIQTPAHGIYTAAGFQVISEEPHHDFGQDLIGQTWVLDLRRAAEHC